MRFAMPFVVVCVCVCVLGVANTGCMSSTRWMEVHLRDTQRVDVDSKQGDLDIARDKNDLKVNGKSMLVEGSFSGRRPATVVSAVGDSAPDAVRTKNGKYTWKRGDVTLTTPKANIDGAEVVTHWNQPMGILPSMLWTVTGAAFALGFGVAGPSLIAEGASGTSDDPNATTTGIALCIGAAGGVALASYGIVSWMLVSGSPHYDPINVVDD